MNDTAAPQPLAAVETFATPEAAQAEYRRYMASPEYSQASQSPHGKGPALARLEALAQRAWPSPGLQSSPAPQTAQEARKGQEAAHDALTRIGDDQPLSEADTFAMASAFAPQSAGDYSLALPGEENAELRQTLFEHGVSKSGVNLLVAGSSLIEQTLALSDEDYFSRTDKALATVRGTQGGKMIARKAVDLVDAIPPEHFYRPFAEYLLTLPGGVIELSHWSDRLRAAKAS